MFIRMHIPDNELMRDLGRQLANHELVSSRWWNQKTRTVTVRGPANLKDEIKWDKARLVPVCLSQKEKWFDLQILR